MMKWGVLMVVALACAGCGGGEPASEAPAATAATEGASAAGSAAPAAAPAVAAPAAAPVAAAPAAPRYREVTIPAGTTLRLALTSAVASDASKIEDPVTATLQDAVVVGGTTVLPVGTAVAGEVTAVERAGRVRGRAQVAYRFTQATVAGDRLALQSEPVTHLAPATKGEDATKIAIGAGAGAAIGALMGGGSGAAKGAAVGAAGGTGVVLATRGEEVRRGAGDEVTTQLAAPLTLRVRVN